MEREKRWWLDQGSRWHRGINAALESGDPYRTSLAWCCLACTSGEHGFQTEFSKITGLSQSVISYYLSGRNQITPSVAQQVASAVETHLGTNLIGMNHLYHPFEVGAGLCWVAPGDSRWETWWGLLRIADPINPSVEELKEGFPNLFPL